MDIQKAHRGEGDGETGESAVNKVIKSDWLKDLRTNQYMQGRVYLCRTNGKQVLFSAFGILCDIHAQRYSNFWIKRLFLNRYKYGGEDQFPPNEVLDWAELGKETALALSEMNDAGKSFEDIADYIDREL